jgi:DNA-binding MarR family transcriptional regulator
MPASSDTEILRDAMRLFITGQRKHLHDGATLPQGRMLVTLLRRGSVTQAEFGRILGLEKSWVSRSVDKLVQMGLVTRSTLEGDRRSVQLQLSDAGQVAAHEVQERMNAHASSVLQALPDNARERVIAALRELRGVLQKQSENA